jgi:hypothetical protein
MNYTSWLLHTESLHILTLGVAMWLVTSIGQWNTS